MDCRVNLDAGIANCGGSKEFYVEILEAYDEEGKKDEMIKAFEDKDWKLYEIDVHSLKGTMRLIGAEEAGDLAEKLQYAAEAKDEATVTENHAILLEMIESSVEKLKSML